MQGRFLVGREAVGRARGGAGGNMPCGFGRQANPAGERQARQVRVAVEAARREVSGVERHREPAAYQEERPREASRKLRDGRVSASRTDLK
jgi:hypothetical protein